MVVPQSGTTVLGSTRWRTQRMCQQGLSLGTFTMDDLMR
jgi:hypothetical protein